MILRKDFNANTTVGQLSAWWFEHVARHRVRPTSLATCRKHASVIGDKLGSVSRGLDANELVVAVADMHPSRDAFPGEVFMGLAADAPWKYALFAAVALIRAGAAVKAVEVASLLRDLAARQSVELR